MWPPVKRNIAPGPDCWAMGQALERWFNSISMEEVSPYEAGYWAQQRLLDVALWTADHTLAATTMQPAESGNASSAQNQS